MQHIRSIAGRFGVAVALLGGTLAGAFVGGSPAQAAQSVSLLVSDTTAGIGEPVTLTANATPIPTGVTWYGISIREVGTDVYVGGCSYYADNADCDIPVSRTFGTYSFVATASSFNGTTVTTEGTSNTVTVTWGLGFTEPPPGPSSDCDSGSRVVDNTFQSARVKVYTLSTATTTDICYRVDVAGEGVGGKIAIVHGVPDVDPGGVGLPTPGTDVDVCDRTSPPNQLPLTNPISDGGIGPVDYSISAYANTTHSVSLCLTVENTPVTVTVPIGGTPGVTPNIDVDHYADPA